MMYHRAWSRSGSATLCGATTSVFTLWTSFPPSGVGGAGLPVGGGGQSYCRGTMSVGRCPRWGVVLFNIPRTWNSTITRRHPKAQSSAEHGASRGFTIQSEAVVTEHNSPKTLHQTGL